jgi:tetratricopeptide (TPR) repeat protein
MERNRRQGILANGWLWLLALLLSVAWWWFTSQGSIQRWIVFSALSLSSFALGCLVGFLFTSYGEESATVGKVRDWLIGSITGITFVQIIEKESGLKRLLGAFVVGGNVNDYGVVVADTVLYATLGFFFMFLQRELILNLLLAQRRAERGEMEGARQAGIVMQRFLVTLPVSILSGVDDVDEMVEFRKGEAEKLRTILYSEELRAFLDQAEEAIKSGASLDWDVVSKVANLQYYRTYFEKDEHKYSQAATAYEWICRALVINPLHVDLTVKCADALSMMDRYDEAVALLERLERTPEAPAYAKQWLGCFLLSVDGRADDAIRYSEEYHRLFPNESDSIFNVAYAYAQKYADELREKGQREDPQSHNRKLALANLRSALQRQPDYAATVRTSWTKPGEGFFALLHDKEFRQVVDLPPEELLQGS